MKKVCIAIPARHDSSRLHGKMLFKIGEDTVVFRTYKQCLKCKYVQPTDVVVFADDDKIVNELRDKNVRVVKTGKDYENGTSRIGSNVHLAFDDTYDVLVNVQGDEPFIDPRNIDLAIEKFIDSKKDDGNPPFYVTVHEKLTDQDKITDSSTLKVVTDVHNNVLYYSRSTIPISKSLHKQNTIEYKGFVGIYVYPIQNIKVFAQLENTPLQQIEDIEQLKVLEHGYTIKSFETPHNCERGVNTMEDWEYLKTKYNF